MFAMNCPYCRVPLVRLDKPMTFTPAAPRAHREVTVTRQCPVCELLFNEEKKPEGEARAV